MPVKQEDVDKLIAKLPPELRAIALKETGGRSIVQEGVDKDGGHSGGVLQMRPETFAGLVARYPKKLGKYSNLLTGDIAQNLADNPDAAIDSGKVYAGELVRQGADSPAKLFYAWNHGAGGLKNAKPEEIANNKYLIGEDDANGNHVKGAMEHYQALKADSQTTPIPVGTKSTANVDYSKQLARYRGPDAQSFLQKARDAGIDPAQAEEKMLGVAHKHGLLTGKFDEVGQALGITDPDLKGLHPIHQIQKVREKNAGNQQQPYSVSDFLGEKATNFKNQVVKDVREHPIQTGIDLGMAGILPQNLPGIKQANDAASNYVAAPMKRAGNAILPPLLKAGDLNSSEPSPGGGDIAVGALQSFGLLSGKLALDSDSNMALGMMGLAAGGHALIGDAAQASGMAKNIHGLQDMPAHAEDIRGLFDTVKHDPNSMPQRPSNWVDPRYDVNSLKSPDDEITTDVAQGRLRELMGKSADPVTNAGTPGEVTVTPDADRIAARRQALFKELRAKSPASVTAFGQEFPREGAITDDEIHAHIDNMDLSDTGAVARAMDSYQGGKDFQGELSKFGPSQDETLRYGKRKDARSTGGQLEPMTDLLDRIRNEQNKSYKKVTDPSAPIGSGRIRRGVFEATNKTGVDIPENQSLSKFEFVNKDRQAMYSAQPQGGRPVGFNSEEFVLPKAQTREIVPGNELSRNEQLRQKYPSLDVGPRRLWDAAADEYSPSFRNDGAYTQGSEPTRSSGGNTSLQQIGAPDISSMHMPSDPTGPAEDIIPENRFGERIDPRLAEQRLQQELKLRNLGSEHGTPQGDWSVEQTSRIGEDNVRLAKEKLGPRDVIKARSVWKDFANNEEGKIGVSEILNRTGKLAKGTVKELSDLRSFIKSSVKGTIDGLAFAGSTPQSELIKYRRMLGSTNLNILDLEHDLKVGTITPANFDAAQAAESVLSHKRALQTAWKGMENEPGIKPLLDNLKVSATESTNFMKVLNGLGRIKKSASTIYNLHGIPKQGIENMLNQYLGGSFMFDPRNTEFYVRGLKAMSEGSRNPAMRMAIRENAYGGMHSGEIHGLEARFQKLANKLQSGDHGGVFKLAAEINEKVGKGYDVMDNLSKLSTFMQAMGIDEHADAGFKPTLPSTRKGIALDPWIKNGKINPKAAFRRVVTDPAEAANHVNNFFVAYNEKSPLLTELTKNDARQLVINNYMTAKYKSIGIWANATKINPVKTMLLAAGLGYMVKKGQEGVKNTIPERDQFPNTMPVKAGSTTKDISPFVVDSEILKVVGNAVKAGQSEGVASGAVNGAMGVASQVFDGPMSVLNTYNHPDADKGDTAAQQAAKMAGKQFNPTLITKPAGYVASALGNGKANAAAVKKAGGVGNLALKEGTGLRTLDGDPQAAKLSRVKEYKFEENTLKAAKSRAVKAFVSDVANGEDPEVARDVLKRRIENLTKKRVDRAKEFAGK